MWRKRTEGFREQEDRQNIWTGASDGEFWKRSFITTVRQKRVMRSKGGGWNRWGRVHACDRRNCWNTVQNVYEDIWRTVTPPLLLLLLLLLLCLPTLWEGFHTHLLCLWFWTRGILSTSPFSLEAHENFQRRNKVILAKISLPSKTTQKCWRLPKTTDVNTFDFWWHLSLLCLSRSSLKLPPNSFFDFIFLQLSL